MKLVLTISFTLCLISVAGAFIVEAMANKLHKFHSDNATKECVNLVLLFSHLYNIQVSISYSLHQIILTKVVHCILIYDIVRFLVNSFKEIDIELLLQLLKSKFIS